MNRLYVVETMPTVTGFKADHRLALKPSEIDALGECARGWRRDGLESGGAEVSARPLLDGFEEVGRPRSGDRRASSLRRRAMRRRMQLNASLGAVGKTVVYTDTVDADSDGAGRGSEVAGRRHERRQGEVAGDAGREPAVQRAGGSGLRRRLQQGAEHGAPGPASWTRRASTPTWHINQGALSGELVGCACVDGTISIVQPMIDPLYGGKTAHDVLQTLLDPSRSAYDAVVANAKTYIKGDFAKAWRRRCTMAGSRARHSLRRPFRAPKAVAPAAAARLPADGTLEIKFLPDPVALRRALCQHRLAAGAAQAGDEPDLGQRSADEPRHDGQARHRGERGDRARAATAARSSRRC